MKFKGAWTKTTGRRPLIIFRDGKKKQEKQLRKESLKAKVVDVRRSAMTDKNKDSWTFCGIRATSALVTVEY